MHLTWWRARAGADRTFSDQHLGQVRGGEQMTEEGTVSRTGASGLHQYLGQVRGGEQVKEEGTVPRTGASGLLVLLVAGRSPRMVHCAWKR